MREVKLKYTDVVVKCRNDREMHLVGIYNNEIDRLIRHMVNKDSIGEKMFEFGGLVAYFIHEFDGMLSAMYFLHMLDEPWHNSHKEVLDGYIQKTGHTPEIYKMLYTDDDGREVSA